MTRLFAALLLSGLLVSPTIAQVRHEAIVTGRTLDGAEQSPLPGVHVVLTSAADSTRMFAAISDSNGEFAIRIAEAGAYELRASFVGFKPFVRDLTIDTTRFDLATLHLEPDVVSMDEVIVRDVQERVVIRGDTAIFNADAYKVNPDASAEDLIAKMPGVVVQDGEVQAQGEQVRRVTVDGREFFGDDPTAALRNLPADVVQSIEVFDRQSDQARFTGFNDGNTEKAINIVTRTGMSNGRFGKAYGGYGAENRYITGGNVNVFDGDRRISIIGLANNVNQQNFAFQDLLGISGRGGGGFAGGDVRIRGGGPPRGGGGRGGGPGGGGPGGGFNPRNFLVGQQAGLNTTSSVGINYSDRFGEKLEMSGSYFFNRMANSSEALLDRQFFLSGDQSQLYSETRRSDGRNYNHRLNMRLEYEVDENNSFIVTPRLSFQDHQSRSTLNGTNVLSTGSMLSEMLNADATEDFGYTSSTGILYRHRFTLPGRTISANVDLGINDDWGDVGRRAETDFFSEAGEPDDLNYDQELDSRRAGRFVDLDVNYTEPIGANGQLRLGYNPAYGKNVSDRSAYVRDLQTGLYAILDPSYSSLFGNHTFAHRAGLTYRMRLEDLLSFNIGLEYESERLTSSQTYPIAFEVDRTFHSLLPEAMIRFELGRDADLRLFYRTNTNTPSVRQLQGVIDNANPLLLTSGNPDLRPSYSHSLFTRFQRGDRRAGRMFFGMANVTFDSNPVGTASLIAERDSTLAQGVVLQRGSQYSYPVNLNDGSLTARSSFVVGTPFPLIKSSLNLNAGVRYSRTPGLINGVLNTANTVGLNGGLTIGSNISELLDFALSYRTDYTIASNSIYPQLDENYMRHRSGFRLTWLPVGGLILESDVNYSAYTGLSEDLYPSSLIWNAGVGYKILQQDAAEVKLVLGDVLNQETGIYRSITEMYVENSRTDVLGRYMLLTLSYRLRNFNM